MSKMDWLLDRLGIRKLIMAAIQMVVWLGIVVFGVVHLGSRMVLPALLITAFHLAALAITLFKPWTTEYEIEPAHTTPYMARFDNDIQLILGAVALFTFLHIRLILMARSKIGAIEMGRETTTLLQADTLGNFIVTDLGNFTWALSSIAVVLLWLLVPLKGSKPGNM